MIPTERRREKRYPFKSPVEIYPVFPHDLGGNPESPDPYRVGELLNLSRNGLAFSTDNKLRSGAVLKLKFAFRPGHWLELFGKVAWSRPGGAGLSFFSLTGVPQKSLQDFLEQGLS